MVDDPHDGPVLSGDERDPRERVIRVAPGDAPKGHRRPWLAGSRGLFYLGVSAVWAYFSWRDRRWPEGLVAALLACCAAVDIYTAIRAGKGVADESL